MFLPYASEFLTDLAQSAIDGACFPVDITDQFLTMLAMDDMAHYDGDGDFGTLTRIDLDDELRVVLSLLDLLGVVGYGEWNVHCVLSHYAQNEVMMGDGGDQKWWADWYPVSTERAEHLQEVFATEYSEYLGCEDCGHGHQDDPCICGDDI